MNITTPDRTKRHVIRCDICHLFFVDSFFIFFRCIRHPLARFGTQARTAALTRKRGRFARQEVILGSLSDR